jgi:hypothetical protein
MLKSEPRTVGKYVCKWLSSYNHYHFLAVLTRRLQQPGEAVFASSLYVQVAATRALPKGALRAWAAASR